MSAEQQLAIGEWAVLGLICEGRTHGFAVSREFAGNGSIGRIWTVPRPLVYRAIASLTKRGLVAEVGSAPGDGGPQRRLVEATPEGRAALQWWLTQPVAHVRDARSDLLMKLLYLDRSGRDPIELLRAQAARLQPILAGLREQSSHAQSFDATLARWRLSSTEALERFVTEEIEGRTERAPTRPRKRPRLG